ncbi:MAG: hypothetical protein WCT14_15355, partial [Treponemataceae bacterium]
QIAEAIAPPPKGWEAEWPVAVPADARWGDADAALVASMLHFGQTTIAEIKKHAELKGACVRW